MLKATKFTKELILNIFKLILKKKIFYEIFNVLNCSKRAIYKVLSRNNNFVRKPTCLRPIVTSFQTGRKIERFKRKQNIYIKQLKIISVSMSQLTRYRRVTDCNIFLEKMCCKPLLKSHHKQARIDCDRKLLTSGSPYYLVTKKSVIWMVLMAGIVTDGIEGNSHLLSSVDDKACLWSFGCRLVLMAKSAWQLSMGNKIQPISKDAREHLLLFDFISEGPEYRFQHDDASIHNSYRTK